MPSARLPHPVSCAPRTGRAIILLLVLLLALLLPPYLALANLGLGDQQLAQIVGSLSLLALLGLLASRLPIRLAACLAAVPIGAMLLVRLTYYGLVQFAGAGFTNDVFIHLEARSIGLAWEQYRWLFVLLAAVLACLPPTLLVLHRHLPRLRTRGGTLLAIMALAGLGTCHQALPEWKLADAARDWYGPKALALPDTELARWRHSGVVDVDLPTKETVQAAPATPPRNLILVYLESLGRALVEPPRYPGLMPHLAHLLETHSLLPDWYSAGFITIEGIANSQCGTLFPFERGSESLAGFDGVAERQPCLGDVLARAGYVQSYLGGAELGFAGKGHFLAAHGYDTLHGWRHWQEIGLRSRPGGWGLGDPDLFDQAFLELERLRQDGRPFNLTLLTIGTHLPGFEYAECKPYGDEPFVNAVHCTDQLLASWLERVEQAGFLSDTVVVITADHPMFPNPQMKRLFGEEATSDKRLPFIVLGAPAPRTVTATAGASYDLAPTVLDLLGVESDARFALGRSAFRADPQRGYFPTRYLDIADGRAVIAPDGDCTGAAPALPLQRCDKTGLLTLLRMQNDAFSNSATTIDCARPGRTGVRMPDTEGEPLQFLIDGEDHAPRFTWRARAGAAARPGLFVAVFAPDGQLLERRFIPADRKALLEHAPEAPPEHAMLLAWRGDPASRKPAPAWLPDTASSTQRAAAVIDSAGVLTAIPSRARDDGTEFMLDADRCKALLP